MTLEEMQKIDIGSLDRHGNVRLYIIDTGQTADPQLRFGKLVKKLSTYVEYISSSEFQQRYPHVEANDVSIRIVSLHHPSEQMREIAYITADDQRMRNIKVEFTRPLNSQDSLI